MDEKLSVGDVIDGTLGTISNNSTAVAIFVVAFTALGAGIEWVFTDNAVQIVQSMESSFDVMALLGIGSAVAISLIVLAVVAQYILWESMLKEAGAAMRMDGRRFLAYIGMAILIGLATGIGYLFLIVPGLILSAKWAAAPAYLISGKRGVIDSMSGSWNDLEGNTTPVVLAILVAGLAIVLASFAVGVGTINFSGGILAPPTVLELILGHLISNVGVVLGIALGAFLFTRLSGDSETYSDVFD